MKTPIITINYSFTAKLSDLPTITTPAEAFNIIWNEWDKNKVGYCEQFAVLVMNTAGKPIGFSIVGEGNECVCIVSPMRILQVAILSNAKKMVLCHNHPSGNINPSEEDLKITQMLINASKLFEIKIDDHIIFNKDRQYLSLSENNFI